MPWCVAGTECVGEPCVGCTPCESGTYKPFDGTAACEKCAEDSYSDQLGALNIGNCLSCPAGSTTGGKTGVGSMEGCTCLEGFDGMWSKSIGLVCHKCPRGPLKMCIAQLLLASQARATEPLATWEEDTDATRRHRAETDANGHAQALWQTQAATPHWQQGPAPSARKALPPQAQAAERTDSESPPDRTASGGLVALQVASGGPVPGRRWSASASGARNIRITTRRNATSVMGEQGLERKLGGSLAGHLTGLSASEMSGLRLETSPPVAKATLLGAMRATGELFINPPESGAM
eukprot:709510-Rhodomonas_salina.1